MEETRYRVIVLSPAADYITSLSDMDYVKIEAAQTIMAKGKFESVETRLLKPPVKELKVKKHRITFFIIKDTICFLTGFAKQTSKTPRQEIEQAYHLYQLMMRKLL